MKKSKLKKIIKRLNDRIHEVEQKAKSDNMILYRAIHILCDKLNIEFLVDMDGLYIDELNIDDEKLWDGCTNIEKRKEQVAKFLEALDKNKGV